MSKPLPPLKVNDVVSHREDTEYWFDGVVTQIDQEFGKSYYTVRWADGTTEVYDRYDIVGKDDPEGEPPDAPAA